MGSKAYQKETLEYEYQARSDVGQVRTNNEDSLIEAPDLGFFGVCDGLTDTMTDEDLEQFLQTDSLTEAADQLVLAANNSGGTDNVTVVLVKILKV